MPFLIQAILVLAFVGLVLWAITQFPLDPTIARLIRVFVIFFVCVWLLLGLLAMFGYNLAPGAFGPPYHR